MSEGRSERAMGGGEMDQGLLPRAAHARISPAHQCGRR
jgi:hypothetical protein